jgi:hypothetical protein
LTLSAVIKKAGPRLASIASATKAGGSAMCKVGAKPYHAIRPRTIARLIARSTSATTAEDAGMIKRGEIDLADEIGVADEAARGFAEDSRKQEPGQHAGIYHDRIGSPSLARQFGEPAEHDRKHHHRQKRPDDGPSDADDDLLVADRDIAPGEDREELAIGPEVTPVMPLGPACFEDQEVAVGERLLTHFGIIGNIAKLW